VSSARQRPASLGSVKSETSPEQFAPVTDANFLEYPVLMDREMLNGHLASQRDKFYVITGKVSCVVVPRSELC
jgi:hypothetical protein